ncbi:hypothetical protein HYALB_00007135 [Hymenoscyphus albidus]|uniref:PLP-dependent transferase n=1 Tax=Hymenoscyphus albidus TaxID=595503 RepID=A0A9N9LGX8_9HELO|nr:hypothetical protein HYALB_00007135 [Hymenoscyphus albidus]
MALNTPLNRADEVEDLLSTLQSLILPFIRSADSAPLTKSDGGKDGEARTALVEYHAPKELKEIFGLVLPDGVGEKTEGGGKEGLFEIVEKVLRFSVNTWDQGFLDKLYASTNAVGLVSELLLAVLNTNQHRSISPTLTIIEKTTTKTLAQKFGFNGPCSGGISTQGGSASNTTSLILARNTLYPSTKIHGNVTHNFVLFTSSHGHYSLEKAAQMCGLGTASVIPVPIDATGRMKVDELERLIKECKGEGKTPFYVNATAGTTVLGSFDDFEAISTVCERGGLWMHVDGSWGGSVIFSEKQRHKLKGVEKANSVAVNPHKMLGVPMTCSFLLGPDMRVFHKANTLPAGYLFHANEEDSTPESAEAPIDEEVWDLADLTLQCGRRGDSLKMALHWIYYGSSGISAQIDHAFSIASYFTGLLASKPTFELVSENPPPCLQVCFYYKKDGVLGDERENGRTTARVVKGLVGRGFLVDYAPGVKGEMFRVVVNVQTRRETVDGLVRAVEEVGGRL